VGGKREGDLRVAGCWGEEDGEGEGGEEWWCWAHHGGFGDGISFWRVDGDGDGKCGVEVLRRSLS